MIDNFDRQKLFDSYSTSLSKGWESYIKIIDLLLGLAGATALVFVASIKVSEWALLPNRDMVKYVFIFSGLSLICGAAWRFASQHFMEYETLGSKQIAEIYFSMTEIDPVTNTHKSKRSVRRFYRWCFRLFPVPMGLFLIAAWACIYLVFFGASTK